MLQVLAVPFKIAAKAANTAARVAAKAQEVATRVALSAAKLTTKMTQKAAELTQNAAGIQARAAARAAANQQARFLASLQKRPAIVQLKEVRHGRMSFDFYRSVDFRRGGQVRESWTLTRDTAQGRVRLATGPMSEFRDIQAASMRAVRRQVTPQPTQSTQSDRRLAPRQAQVSQASRQVAPKQAPDTQPRKAEPPQRARRSSAEPSAPYKKTWHTVVLADSVDRNKMVTGRVVRSFRDPTRAEKAARNPGLIVYEHQNRYPPMYGKTVTFRATDVRKLQAVEGDIPRRSQGVLNGQAVQQAARNLAIEVDDKHKQKQINGVGQGQ